MRQRAADRAAVTDLRVADQAGRVGDQRAVLLGERVVVQLVVARARPDRQVVAPVPHPAQLGHPADVDQRARLGEAQLHQREEAVAAGDELGVLLRAQQLEGVVGQLRDLVVEACRDHDRASWIAFQTLSGVAGRSRSVTPRCERASMTAPTTAGGAAIVPASPIPLTPSGFVGLGVTV